MADYNAYGRYDDDDDEEFLPVVVSLEDSIPWDAPLDATTLTSVELMALPTPIIQQLRRTGFASAEELEAQIQGGVEALAPVVVADNVHQHQVQDVQVEEAVAPEAVNYEVNGCSICMELDDDDLHTLDCDHYFHAICIYTWLHAHKNACPLCRLEVDL